MISSAVGSLLITKYNIALYALADSWHSSNSWQYSTVTVAKNEFVICLATNVGIDARLQVRVLTQSGYVGWADSDHFRADPSNHSILNAWDAK